MTRVAVIDSSCLISLAHLELASKLSLYFVKVYVPRRVQEEVNKKSRFRRRLNKLYNAGLFQRCSCADETRVQLLTAGKLGAGEAEGLVQAQERGVAYFIADEKLAREIAARQGLTSVGTLRLIARLSSEGHAEEVDILVRRLRKELKFRAQDALISQAIAQASNPI